MSVEADKIEAIVETMQYETRNHEGVVNYDSEMGYVDIDRVNVMFNKVFELHNCYVSKIKEDAPKDDGVVRVWFRQLEKTSE